MRKKHDEGYALVFVLVVVTVLSGIAIALMTGALKNLQAQTAAVERMQAKYEAQGEIEKKIAQLVDNLTNPAYASDKGPYNNYYVMEENSPKGAKPTAERLLGLDDIEWDENKTDVRLKLNASSDESKQVICRIECEVVLKNVIIEDTSGEILKYYISTPEIEYSSYTVRYSDASEGGATG